MTKSLKNNVNLKLNDKKFKKRKFKLFSFFFVLIGIFILYLMYITSYTINIDGMDYTNFYDVFLYRFLHPYPFTFTFSIYSLLWILIYLLSYCLWLASNLTPKGDKEWEGIEQGSSHFMDSKELNEFLDLKTDAIKEVKNDELDLINKYIKEYEDKK